MDEATFAALRLSAEGMGSVKEILDSPVDLVIHMIHFSRYRTDLVNTEQHLNKEDRK